MQEMGINWMKLLFQEYYNSNHFSEATKHLLHVQTLNDFETHLKHEQTLIEAAGTTMEFRDGIHGFLN
ncbi:hypothetical protein N9X28_00485 [Candidatus Poseidoniales archaeon]|nr:hypothetical protein [Candidatus Poseidoniales archaeon]